MTLALRSPRTVIAATIALTLVVVGLFAGPAARAADAVDVAKFDVELPAGTAEVWFAAEHGGTVAEGTTLAVASATAPAALVGVSATTFGAGAIISSSANHLVAYVASTSAVTPDVSFTAVDDDGRILSILSARVSLAANPDTDLPSIIDPATPVELTPTEPAKSAATGELGITGGTIAWSIVLVALALIALGAGLLIRRRHVRSASEGVTS